MPGVAGRLEIVSAVSMKRPTGSPDGSRWRWRPAWAHRFWRAGSLFRG